MRAAWAASATLWRNTTDSEVSSEEVIVGVGANRERIPDFHYAEVRCEPTPTGFVQTHLLSGTSPTTGESFGFQHAASVLSSTAAWSAWPSMSTPSGSQRQVLS